MSREKIELILVVLLILVGTPIAIVMGSNAGESLAQEIYKK